MTSMKDFLPVDLNDDPNIITNESFVENTVETPTWYTVEDNRSSLISEDVEKKIKVETDLLDDCMWQSRIDVAKYGEKSSSSLYVNVHQNSSNSDYINSNSERSFTENCLCYVCGQPFGAYFDLEHHLEIHHELTQNVSCYNSDINHGIKSALNAFLCDVCGESFVLDLDFRKHIQEHNKTTENASDSNSGLNRENNKLLKTFCCDICGKCFVLELDLDNHLREHMKQKKVNISLVKCNFCEKEFKLNFLLNKHIKKCHESNINNVINMCECSICKTFVDEAIYDKHVKAHKSRAEKDNDFIVNLKLSKLNGVWKPNFVYKCNICDEKFQNEICLTEHMTIHKRNDNQIQSKDGLNTTPISRSNFFTQQIHDSNNLKCQKCDLKFDKKENLDLHTMYCTKSSRNIWSKFLGPQNNSKVSDDSPVCGINFNNMSHFIICKFCQTTFDTKELWSKHLDVCRIHNKCEPNMHINSTGVNEAQNLNILENTSIPYLKKENIQRSQLSLRKMSDLLACSANNDNQSLIKPTNLFMDNLNVRVKRFKSVCSNVTDKKHSVVTDAGNGSEGTKQTVLYNLVDENNSVSVESDKILCLNDVQQNSLLIQNTENINETVVQVAQSDSMVNDCRPLIKKEKGSCITVNEINNLNQVNLSGVYRTLPEPHSVMSYNRDFCLKKEGGLNTNTVESNNFDSTHTANSPECTMLTETSQTIVKQEPIHLESNIVERIDRQTIYFTVKQTTFKGNVCSNNTNYRNFKQVLESNVLCICKICKKSFTNTHTLALHMSNHQECSMHECVVCNEEFETVLLWTSHMAFHQQQEDLMLLEAPNNSIITEPNVTDTSYVVSAESQTMTVDENKKNNTRLRMKQQRRSSHSDVSTSLNIDNKSKPSHFNFTLPHQTITSIIRSFSCNYCDRTFSGQGPLTNHEKSHTNPNKNKLLVPDIDVSTTTFDQVETNFDIQVKDNTTNSVTIQPQLQSLSSAPKRFVCFYCNRRFAKKCHRTNHMRFLHKKCFKLMTPTTLEIENNVEINKTGSVSTGEQSFNPSPKVKSIKDHKNNSFVSISTNLSNINVKTRGNAAYCTICKKKFGHFGALANHMHIHSNRKPYKCRYCNRKFNMKGPCILHETKHNNLIDVKNIQAQNLGQVNNVEMTEVKGGEEEQPQLELKENLNDIKLFDTNLNDNLYSKNCTKKDRMWFVCDVCDKKFSTPFQLILHRRLQHDSVSPYVCKICDKSYTVRHCWNRHLKGHYIRSDCVTNLKNGMHTNNTRSTSKDRNQFKCGYCKKEYNLIYHWKKHLTLSKECRRHCKSKVPEFTSVQAKNYYSKSRRFECKICKRTYSTDYNRKVHITNVHGIELGTDQNSLTYETPIQLKLNSSNEKRRRGSSYNTPYKCDLCGKCYSSVNNLSRHRTLSHSEDRTTTCKICGRSFKHQYSYREHCKIKHKFLLQTNNGLKLNAIINSNNANQCVTGIKNKNITAQNTNKHTKTQLEYECKDCGQHFDTNIILGQHIIQNHPVQNMSKRLDEKTDNALSRSNNSSSIKCNVCFKSFSSVAYLSKHMVMHSDIRPYKCDVCDMSFRFKPNLSMHKKKHNAVTVG